MPETNDNSLSDVIEKLNSKIDTLGKEVKESSSKKGLIGDLNTGLESLAENIVNSVKAPFEGISKGLGSLKDSVSAPFKSMKKFISAPLKGLEIGKRLFGKKKSADGDMIKPLQAIKLGIDKLVQSSVGSIPFIASTSNLIERNTADLAVSTDQNTTILDSTGNEIKLEAEKSKEIVSTVTQTEKTTTALVDAVKNSSVVFVNAISESHKGSSETLNTTDKTVSTSNVTSSVSAIDSKETEKFSLTDLVKDFASTVSSFVGGNTDKPIDKTLVATSKETSSTGSTTSNTKSDVNSNTLLSVIADKSSAIFSAVSDKSSSLFDKISSNSASTISSASDTSSTLAAKSSSILQAIADKSASIFNTVSDKSSSLLSTISDKITTTVVGGKGKDSQKLGTKEKVITAGVQSSGISNIEKTDSMSNAIVSSITTSSNALSESISKLHDGNSSSLHSIDKSLVENNSNVTTDRLQEREVQKDRIARSEKLVTAIGNIEIDASEKIEKKGFLSGLFSDIKFVLTASIVGFGKSIALKVGSMFVKTAGLLKGKLAGTKIGTGMKSMKEKVGATKIGTSFKERRAARNQGITSTKNVKSLNVDKVRESPTRKRRGKAGRGVASKAGGGIASIGKGAGKGITGFLKGIGRGLKAISNPKYLIGAGVLIALGGALFITGKALKLFTGIDWKGVLLGVGVLTALGVGAALLGSIGPMILIGAAAIAALGAALIPAGIAFNSFSGVDWKGVGIGISVLTALGAAAFGLSLISPAIFVGALAIAALGAALIPAAAAFNLFSNGLAAFESFLPVLGEFVDGALGGLIDLSAAGPGLLSAAVGIGAVSAALIAFGASSALGGLLSFFGGDPIEKFLKLADRATDLGVAGQALKTITDSINQFDSEPIDLMSISIHKLADALGMLQDGMMKKDPLKPLKRLAQIDIEEVANNFKKIGDGASKLIKLAGGSTSDVEDNITNIAASSGVMGGATLNSAKDGGNVSGLEKNINSSSLVKSGVLEAEASQSGAFMQNKYNETTAIKGINEEARGSGGGDANVVVQGSTTSQVTNTTINNDAHVDRTMMLIPSF